MRFLIFRGCSAVWRVSAGSVLIAALIATGCKPAAQAPVASLALSDAGQSDAAAINNYLLEVAKINNAKRVVLINSRIAIARLANEGHHSVDITNHIVETSNAAAQDIVRKFYSLSVPSACKPFASLYGDGLKMLVAETQSYATLVSESGPGKSTTTAATNLKKTDVEQAKLIQAQFDSADKEVQNEVKANPGTRMPLEWYGPIQGAPPSAPPMSPTKK